MASTSKRKPEQQRGTVMRLHLVRGSFCTAEDAAGSGGGGGCPSMDAEVWSRLPDEIIWDVLLLLPAAKHFQLQLVCRKWRQVLTSSYFRNKVMAAAPGEWEQQQQQCVVACVSDGDDPDNSSSSSGSGRKSNLVNSGSSSSKKLKVVDSGSSNNTSNKVKVVDIDLSSFVPDWFWNSKSDTYSLVAVGAGLMCISNNSEYEHDGFLDEKWPPRRREEWEPWKPWTNQYCVINPVTRTCTVLPKLPFKPLGWLPLTTGTLTIYKECQVATYDLASGGGWILAAHDFGPLNTSDDDDWEPACMELCGRETYRYHDGQVHVLVPGPGGARLVDAAAPVDAPLVSLLGLNEAKVSYMDNDVDLVTHRGSVFAVAYLTRTHSWVAWSGVLVGVWRLVRSRMEWQPVTRLLVRDVERLTGLSGVEGFNAVLCGVHGLRQLLCCRVCLYLGIMTATRRPATFLLGFDLDSNKWELVHHDQAVYWKPESGLGVAMPLELAPHLFLSQTKTPTLE